MSSSKSGAISPFSTPQGGTPSHLSRTQGPRVPHGATVLEVRTGRKLRAVDLHFEVIITEETAEARGYLGIPRERRWGGWPKGALQGTPEWTAWVESRGDLETVRDLACEKSKSEEGEEGFQVSGTAGAGRAVEGSGRWWAFLEQGEDGNGQVLEPCGSRAPAEAWDLPSQGQVSGTHLQPHTLHTPWSLWGQCAACQG